MAADPGYSLRDLIRCNLCETPVPLLHFKTCHKQLCKVCFDKHILNESKDLEVELLVYNNCGEPIENSLSSITFTEYEGDIQRRSFRAMVV